MEGLVYLGQHMVWRKEKVPRLFHNMAKDFYDGFI